MAGILDSKERVMDVILTEEGRRQLASGFMRVEFASFTDRQTFYEGSIVSGTADASDRIFLEATSLPQDQITYETDDFGNLIGFTGGTFDVLSTGEVYGPGVTARVTKITGSTAFASITGSLMNQAIDNFKNQRLLSTVGFIPSSSFELNTNSVNFAITETSPIPSAYAKTCDIDSVAPLFASPRMAHVRQYKFLPPQYYWPTAPIGQSTMGPIGTYVDLSGRYNTTLSDFLNHVLFYKFSAGAKELLLGFVMPGRTDDDDFELHAEAYEETLTFMEKQDDVIIKENFDSILNGTFSYSENFIEKFDRTMNSFIIDHSGTSHGYYNIEGVDEYWLSGEGSPWILNDMMPSQEIIFEKNSESGNIMIQMFEVRPDRPTMLKLDIIDGGFFSDQYWGNRQIYYMGKVFTDSLGMPSFVNLFTMIFS